MTNPLIGVWELDSEEEDGLFIVTETHFTDLTVREGRTPWPMPLTAADVTDEMRADAFKGLLFAIGGTYEVLSQDGEEWEFRFHPVVSHYPVPLNDFSHRIRFEGDTASGYAGGRYEVWRRVGTA